MGDKEISKEDVQLAALASTITDEKVKPQKGMVARIWSAMGLVGHLFFRNSKEDFEKRLQHLSKEEVAVHSRLKRRTAYWRKFARNLILYSVIGEVASWNPWLLSGFLGLDTGPYTGSIRESKDPPVFEFRDFYTSL